MVEFPALLRLGLCDEVLFESYESRAYGDNARAIYEALADYFGHAGHDIRALRKDYDAERARVDKLIHHAIGGAPR